MKRSLKEYLENHKKSLEENQVNVVGKNFTTENYNYFKIIFPKIEQNRRKFFWKI